MSIFERSAGSTFTGLRESLPSRTSPRGKPAVTSKLAMSQSVIWAAMNLHAALESMFPVDVMGEVDGIKVNRPTPPVLVFPSEYAEGHFDTIADWLYATRMSLQGWGNVFGEITQINSNKLPARIQLVPAEDVTLKISNRRIVEYRFGRTVYPGDRVWHERGALLPGIPVGLSPIAYAMLTTRTSAAARQFADDWFGNSGYPGGHLKNTAKTLKDGESRGVKAKFRRDVAAGDLFVTGSDWTFTPIQAKAVEAGFLEAMNHTDVELARFFNTPANIIDVASTGSARITYANITQANLDFMVSRMGPNLKRRNDALTLLTPKPQFVRLNPSAFLAMDDLTRTQLLRSRIESRMLTPDQARHLEDQPALTEDDYAQFDRLFGNPNKTTPQEKIS